jgi:hypothetical protein
MHCILHIGLKKTGTTSIQRCLTKNRRQTARRGVLYPRCLGHVNHDKAAFRDARRRCELLREQTDGE